MDFSTQPLKLLRYEAQDQDEWATKRLWMHIFSKFVFKDLQYIVSSEQPPTYNTLRRVDIVVETVSDRRGKMPTLLVLEAKRGRAEPNDIVEVETQAYTAAREYMKNHGRDSVWAMTCFGPNARFWACFTDVPVLVPLYPIEGGHGEREIYVDIKDGLQTVLEVFKAIKKNHIPKPEMLPAYDRTVNADNSAKSTNWDTAMREPSDSISSATEGLPPEWASAAYGQSTVAVGEPSDPASSTAEFSSMEPIPAEMHNYFEVQTVEAAHITGKLNGTLIRVDNQFVPGWIRYGDEDVGGYYCDTSYGRIWTWSLSDKDSSGKRKGKEVSVSGKHREHHKRNR